MAPTKPMTKKCAHRFDDNRELCPFCRAEDSRTSKDQLRAALAEWDRWQVPASGNDHGLPFNVVLTNRGKAMECLIEAVRADVRSAPEPPAVPCKGKNCGSIDPRLHSADCFEEYERSSGASLPPSAWQPIATAPKYQDVLLWRADAGAMIGQWRGMDGLIDENDEAFDADFEAWFANDTGWMEGAEAPTDWQPLPSGPTKGDNHG